MYRYEINEKKYTQKKLVLGQIGALAQLLASARFMGADPLSLISSLGELLPQALAIVLVPDGMHPADKDLLAMERDLYEAEPETALQVVEDFFDCNPLPSLLEKIAGLMEKFNKVTG